MTRWVGLRGTVQRAAVRGRALVLATRRVSLRRFMVLLAFPLIAAFGAMVGSATAAPASIRISCGAVGQEFEMCKTAAETWAAQSGNKVQVVATPSDSSQRLAIYRQILDSHSDKIDVFQLDVVWPGMLAPHLLDLKPYAQGAEAAHFPSIIANNTAAGRLVAMPWFMDVGLLYYRKDLLARYRRSVPSTWDELAATARLVMDAERSDGNERMWGYVWQGRADEGLTCDALEWFASHGAGAIVDAGGRVTVNDSRSVKALEQAAGWVGGITPRAVLNYGEEEARGVFGAGNALFMRNWPYAWALLQADASAVRGKVGIAVLPRGGADGRHAATLGGQQLAVSLYTKNPAAAASLVMYMTSAAVQKDRAIRGSFNPTLTALYKDAEILAANPHLSTLVDVFGDAAVRPTAVTAAHYGEVSQAYWQAVHAVLAGRVAAAPALADLEARLQRMAPGGQWR